MILSHFAVTLEVNIEAFSENPQRGFTYPLFKKIINLSGGYYRVLSRRGNELLRNAAVFS